MRLVGYIYAFAEGFPSHRTCYPTYRQCSSTGTCFLVSPQDVAAEAVVVLHDALIVTDGVGAAADEMRDCSAVIRQGGAKKEGIAVAEGVVGVAAVGPTVETEDVDKRRMGSFEERAGWDCRLRNVECAVGLAGWKEVGLVERVTAAGFGPENADDNAVGTSSDCWLADGVAWMVAEMELSSHSKAFVALIDSSLGFAPTFPASVRWEAQSSYSTSHCKFCSGRYAVV